MTFRFLWQHLTIESRVNYPKIWVDLLKPESLFQVSINSLADSSKLQRRDQITIEQLLFLTALRWLCQANGCISSVEKATALVSCFSSLLPSLAIILSWKRTNHSARPQLTKWTDHSLEKVRERKKNASPLRIAAFYLFILSFPLCSDMNHRGLGVGGASVCAWIPTNSGWLTRWVKRLRNTHLFDAGGI